VNVWQRRSRRARFLSESYPACSQILTFYAQLAEWQGSVAAGLTGFKEINRALPSLLEFVKSAGPTSLREAAEEMSDEDSRLADMIRRHWDSPAEPSLDDFFAVAVLQVVSSHLPEGMNCPWCVRAPLAGCLREQGDGKSLHLVCPLCLRRRAFARGRCPACGESSESKQSSFSTEIYPHLRVQACENCQGYFNVVDLTRDPAAIPEVDELAALPLDLWAAEHGYRKLQTNIAGV